jgi:hypothetical protein
LPAKQEPALQNALTALQNMTPTAKCESKIVNALSAFVFSDYQSYLSAGADFFDGTRSTVPAATTIYPSVAAASWQSSNPGVTTMASLFSAQPGLQAITASQGGRLTVYLRPGTMSNSQGGVNSRNIGLVFHEGLHGFGQGSAFDDTTLKLQLGLRASAPSRQISDKISKNCGKR